MMNGWSEFAQFVHHHWGMVIFLALLASGIFSTDINIGGKD